MQEEVSSFQSSISDDEYDYIHQDRIPLGQIDEQVSAEEYGDEVDETTPHSKVKLGFVRTRSFRSDKSKSKRSTVMGQRRRGESFEAHSPPLRRNTLQPQSLTESFIMRITNRENSNIIGVPLTEEETMA